MILRNRGLAATAHKGTSITTTGMEGPVHICYIRFRLRSHSLYYIQYVYVKAIVVIFTYTYIFIYIYIYLFIYIYIYIYTYTYIYISPGKVFRKAQCLRIVNESYFYPGWIRGWNAGAWQSWWTCCHCLCVWCLSDRIKNTQRLMVI